MNLSPGDVIALISPSWCGPEVFPHVFESGIKNIEAMGFTVKEFPFTRKQGTAREKASDIHAAFLDTEVKAIICSIGGDDSTFVLQHLDKDLLRQNSKPIMGFSDSTALFVFMHQLGIPCYYGPSVMAGLAQIHEYPSCVSYTKSVLRGIEQSLKAYPEYSEGYLDWKKSKIGVDTKKKNDGFHFLNDLESKGTLFGGCMEVLEFLKGTRYWPNDFSWTDTILFLETSEEKPSVTQVKYVLRNYGFMGILQKIKGLLFGRACYYSDDEKKELEKIILQVLEEFSVSIPVVTNMDFGHTDPLLILKYGDKVSISKKRILLL